jgi:hypothetical protein
MILSVFYVILFAFLVDLIAALFVNQLHLFLLVSEMDLFDLFHR